MLTAEIGTEPIIASMQDAKAAELGLRIWASSLKAPAEGEDLDSMNEDASLVSPSPAAASPAAAKLASLTKKAKLAVCCIILLGMLALINNSFFCPSYTLPGRRCCWC